MKTKLLLVLIVILSNYALIAQVPDRQGLWKFDDSANLVKAEIGADLALTGSQISVGGPSAGNGATQIGLGSYLTMAHGMAANGGGAMVNDWSLQIDFLVPNIDAWYAFFQTTEANNNDADLFIKKTAGTIGTARSTYSTNVLTAEAWHRLVVTKKQGEFYRIYIDGSIWVETPDMTIEEFYVDGRWALEPNLVIFGDDDGDDGLINCAELAIWNTALSAEQVAEMGDANKVYNTVAVVPDRKGLWKFDDAANLTKAEIGTDLVLTGSQTSVNGPVDGNKATQIGLGSYLNMEHGIAANGGGAMVNEYSLQFDFSVQNIDVWYTFFQTDVTNTSDGDMFVKKTAGTIGTSRSTYSTNAIAPNTWYRMVITVKQEGFFRVYIDGELWIETADISHEYFKIDNRWALDTKLLLFADNDGDDGLINCSELAIWDVALSAEQVAVLGKAADNATAATELQMNDKNQLGQNFPNPFSNFTTVPYQMTKSGNVVFRVIDINGSVVRIIDEGKKPAGSNNFQLSSEKMSNGIYYLQMITDKQTVTRKMILSK